MTISGAFALTVCGELILAVLAGVEVVVVLVVMVFDVVVDAVADSDVVVATLFAPPYPSWAGGRETTRRGEVKTAIAADEAALRRSAIGAVHRLPSNLHHHHIRVRTI